MATHSNILAWRIPWKEDPGGLQLMGVTKESDMTKQLVNIGRMEVLQADCHGLIWPWSLRPCITGAMPNKAS